MCFLRLCSGDLGLLVGCEGGIHTVQVYVKTPVICAQSLENFLKSTFFFKCFRERGAGPGASRAYGRDGRTDAGPKISLFFEIQSLISYPNFSYFKLRPRRTTRDGRTDPAGPPGTDGRTRKALKNHIFLYFLSFS